MAKIRQTDEQQEALKYISSALKELEKLKAVLSGEFELTAKSVTDGKPFTVKLDLGEVKAKSVVKSYGLILAQGIEQRSGKYVIELENEEQKLCSFFKAKAKIDPADEEI